MRITVVQTDIVWAQPHANAERAERLMEQASGSDLYVLPEMWSTGFATDPEGIAEEGDTSLTWMRKMSARLDAALSGSIAIKAGESASGGSVFANRHYFVKPDGTYAYYDKHHLFGYGGENTHYTAGDLRTVVSFRGMRFLLITCYDLRFPVWCRYRDDYDGIIVSANWPDTRIGVWDILLKARAIENQCVVVACNRVGSDKQCTYNGHSAIIDAKGHVITQAVQGHECTMTADISIEEIIRFRKKFNVLDDRD